MIPTSAGVGYVPVYSDDVIAGSAVAVAAGAGGIDADPCTLSGQTRSYSWLKEVSRGRWTLANQTTCLV